MGIPPDCQGSMKTVVSASRRTDLVAFFPAELAAALRAGRARVAGPRGRVREIDLRPESVHTLVLWSKDFRNLLDDAFGLRELAARAGPLYLHFTLTGLGGGPAEPGAPPFADALAELDGLVGLAGDPRRVSPRFDPVVFWREGGSLRSNLSAFDELVKRAAALGIRDIRTSVAQWYRKAASRARRRGFDFVDPPAAEKIAAVKRLAEAAGERGLALHVCAQAFLAAGTGARPSACIDGRLLAELHPRREPAATGKDRTQRPECGCTESVDIGNYLQACPHGCVYCYANPGP